MSYDDDFPIYDLEHYGVKGMKWGVRKKVSDGLKKIGGSVKSTVAEGIVEQRAKDDAFHDKKMMRSKTYKLLYKTSPRTIDGNGRDRVRQKAAKASYRAMQRSIVTMTLSLAVDAALTNSGQKAIRSVSDFVITGQAQKIGKNVLNTVTGSPLRYVNAENMKNVVVDSGALGGR